MSLHARTNGPNLIVFRDMKYTHKHPGDVASSPRADLRTAPTYFTFAAPAAFVFIFLVSRCHDAMT